MTLKAYEKTLNDLQQTESVAIWFMMWLRDPSLPFTGQWCLKDTELLKQLALEMMDVIQLNAAKIYTDGSKEQTNTTASGVLIKLSDRVIKFQRRNADHAYGFR
ncbi:hypothetical protein TNCV_2223941 [Trichonephila clavipes]|nr:hypothetical protein TNCV_2223941 [Trichonephila clavipes]